MANIYQESSTKKDSVTLACRFDRTLYELLKKDSREKNISLNSLINSIVKKYVSWERYAAEIGFIPLSKETVRLILDNLDEEKIRTIGEQLGRTIPRELILLMFNRIDFDSILSFIEITSSRYGRVQHNNGLSYHDFILYHGVSKRFSDFLAAGLTAMAEDLSLKVEVLNADSKLLSVRINESSVG
ncbi:MAG: hypothetical protein HMLIMOIP_001727 [Candidatus Nitrosomirales archaeon]|jgi:hypothetical protein